MAFPSIRSSSSGAEPSDVTSHTVTLPATISAGDLLLIFIAVDGSGDTVTWPGSWVELYDDNNANAAACAYLFAVGDEDGTNITVTSSSSENSAWHAYAFQDAHASTAPEVGGTLAAGDGTAPNPPSLTPSWADSEDTMYWAHVSMDEEISTSSYPTNYSDNNSTLNSDPGQGATCTNIVASRNLSKSGAEDPGVFTTATGKWITNTLAIRPAASSGNPWYFYSQQ